jgi:hypothetical protein
VTDPTLESIRRHSATALGIARGYCRKLPRSIPREDIEQAALDTLCKHDEETV